MENIKKLFKDNYEKSCILFELTVGLYLLQCNYRKIFQIYIDINNKTTLKEITDIITSTKFGYIKKNKDQSTISFIIYNKTYCKKYPRQLENFYNFAINNKTYCEKYSRQFHNIIMDKDDYLSYENRITINTFKYGKVKNSCEIYGQMCKKENISENINVFLEIAEELKLLLLKLDKDLSININIEILK